MTEQNEVVAARCPQCGQDMRGTDYIQRIKDELDTLRLALLNERERCAGVCADAKRLPPRDQFEDGANRTAAYLEHSIRSLPDPCDLTKARKTLQRLAELEKQLDGYKAFKASVDEALNTGDGSYRP